jgi:hypothetical protein
MRRAVTVGFVAMLALTASVMSSTAGTSQLRHRSASPAAGYWLVGEDGGVFSFGSGPFYGSGLAVRGACAPSDEPMQSGGLSCSGIASTPSGNGYWLLNSLNWPTGYGAASEYPPDGCAFSGPLGTIWVGMTSSATGFGFLLASSNGAVAGCGDIVPAGGLTSLRLAAPIVGIAATPDHKGYWSMGGIPLNDPVVGIAPSPDGKGYWLVAADGGVFSFGDAGFYGSMGGSDLNGQVVAIAASPTGKGYWLAATDGGVFSFGRAPFEGSMGGQRLDAPIVGIATYP